MSIVNLTVAANADGDETEVLEAGERWSERSSASNDRQKILSRWDYASSVQNRGASLA